MSSPELPGLDVSGRVRARDIQMAGVADVRRRVLMISGAIDTPDHDISISVNLPEPGRWQIIKSETNLTDRTWVAMQAVLDYDRMLLVFKMDPRISGPVPGFNFHGYRRVRMHESEGYNL